jgi:hypothetical protein
MLERPARAIGKGDDLRVGLDFTGWRGSCSGKAMILNKGVTA